MVDYWDKSRGPREFCYRIVPLEIQDDVRKMTVEGFQRVYDRFGSLGYRFRDAGHNHEKVVVSLNKRIRPEHIRELENEFSVVDDNGWDLSGI